MGLQPGKGAALIPAHQARVAHDICRENRRQFALLTGQGNILRFYRGSYEPVNG